MKAILSLVLAVALAAGVAGVAAADEPAKPYRSEMREKCEEELAKDKLWSAELQESVRPSVHEADAAIMLKNKKHVVMAYAALWILTVAFLVLLWLRQRKLVAEIARLEARVSKAAAE
ncbi:MAG TPA: hypothetical protein VMZ28_05135 [Kofleriaceae bacterium]|nr:hypothetical protein [Kofleriaceae bacterium]